MKKWFTRLGCLLLLLSWGAAWGQIPSSDDLLSGDGGTIDVTGKTNLVDYAGDGDAEGFKSLAMQVTKFIRQFTIPLGVVILVWAGVELFMSRGNDETLKEKNKQVTYVCVGYFVILLAEELVFRMFFGEQGEIFMDGGSEKVSKAFGNAVVEQVGGFFDYLSMFSVAILLLFVLISALQLSLGGEDDQQITMIKRRLVWGGIGLFIISAGYRIMGYFFGYGGGAFFQPDQAGLIQETTQWINFLLGYVAFLGVVGIIIAGIYMIFYFGDDQRIEQGKKIMVSVIVGLLVAFSALVIVKYFLFPSYDTDVVAGVMKGLI